MDRLTTSGCPPSGRKNQVGRLASKRPVVEQVVHEVAVEVTAQHVPAQTAIWADESESDFQAFQSALARLRSTDTWRTGA
jgi:hypothetical protein